MKRVNYPIGMMGDEKSPAKPVDGSKFPYDRLRSKGLSTDRASLRAASPNPVRSPEAAVRPSGNCKRGLTLIELMVAALIMVVVTGAALTLFRITATYQRHQQDLISQTQNLRAALYTVTRDIRMAGGGLPLVGSPLIYIYVDPAMFNDKYQEAPAGWFTYIGTGGAKFGIRPIMGTDSGTNKNESDSLTIFYAELEATYVIGRLETAFKPSASTDSITLDEAVAESVHFSDGDIFAISDGNKAVIVQVTAEKTVPPASPVSSKTLKLGPRFRPMADLPDGFEFSAGSRVFNFRNATFVTYYVDIPNRRLVADYHDASMTDLDADDMSRPHLVTVAENIEDFQVCYFLSANGSIDLVKRCDINPALLDNSNEVKAVQVAMVSRSRNRSKLSRKAEAIEVMGHKTEGEDGYTRRTLSEVIQLRNY